MDNQRRKFLTIAGLGAGAAALSAAAASAAPQYAANFSNDAESALRAGSSDDQTASLQRAIDRAASARTPLTLAAGTYRASGLELPPGAQINGVPGATRIVANRARPIMSSAHAGDVRLSGIAFDGGGQTLPDGAGLVSLADGERVRVASCEFVGAAGFGLALDGIGGEVTGCTVLGAADAAIFSINARGLSIARNRIRRAGNNGIQVWRSSQGEDGTLVTDNSIEEIGNRSGGTGQNGNGINVFRAGGVTVRGNRIRDRVFSAIRGNGSSNIRIVENDCRELGEVALYAEFAFEGAIIANNTVDGAALGVAVTNFKQGGRLAVVQGNLIRNLLPKRPPGTDPNDGAGIGIGVEADTAVLGNVIEDAPTAGIAVGWGQYQRDVTVTGNIVRRAAVGITVSVSEGAGAAIVTDNLIAEARHGAIVGMDRKLVATGDLTKQSVGRFTHLTISGNRVR
jgi:uncharacterized secreted repeat protein (TIGR03808 family)